MPPAVILVVILVSIVMLACTAAAIFRKEPDTNGLITNDRMPVIQRHTRNGRQ